MFSNNSNHNLYRPNKKVMLVTLSHANTDRMEGGNRTEEYVYYGENSGE